MRCCTHSFALIAALATACAGPELAREEAAPHPEAPRQAAASGARRAAPVEAEGGLVLPRPVLDRVLRAGPGYFLSQVPLDPVIGPGKRFGGFRVAQLFGNDARVLRFGVLPGDILVAISGQRIVTPGDLLNVFERLKTADVLSVDVLRAGVPRTFRVPIEPALGALPRQDRHERPDP